MTVLDWDKVRVAGQGPVPDDLAIQVRHYKWHVLVVHYGGQLVDYIRERLEKGAELLWTLEQTGKQATDRYQNGLALYQTLLDKYERACDAWYALYPDRPLTTETVTAQEHRT